MLKKCPIFFLLLFVSSLHGENISWKQYKLNTLLYQRRIVGWCTIEKAEGLMDFVYKIQPKTCVEIGVFGGASIYPVASAMRYAGIEGMIYAIDPWSSEECLRGFSPGEEDYLWWDDINLEEIYHSFITLLNRYQIARYCKVMRMKSLDAVAHFADESIDMLHIDGSHIEDAAYSDTVQYLPKVKKGGYIWFDDADKPSTLKALEYLKKYCTYVSACSAGREGSQCLLFIKN